MFGRDQFFECFTRLSGASDVSDELLARRSGPGTYGAWDEQAGADARRSWRGAHGDPLRGVRAYRNRLVHGRIVPEVYLQTRDKHGHVLGDALYYPRLEKVDNYLDWRVAFDANSGGVHPDFDDAALIVLEAWDLVVSHVEQAWRQHLV